MLQLVVVETTAVLWRHRAYQPTPTALSGTMAMAVEDDNEDLEAIAATAAYTFAIVQHQSNLQARRTEQWIAILVALAVAIELDREHMPARKRVRSLNGRPA